MPEVPLQRGRLSVEADSTVRPIARVSRGTATDYASAASTERMSVTDPVLQLS